MAMQVNCPCGETVTRRERRRARHQRRGTRSGRSPGPGRHDVAGADPGDGAGGRVTRRPRRTLASPAHASSRDQAARLQVVPRAGRGAPRAGRRRGRRAERLRQVERRRRHRLGGRLAGALGAPGREARRRPLCGWQRPLGRGLLRGRAPVRQPGRRRPAAVLGAVGRAPAAPRRRGPVPAQPHRCPPDRPRRAPRRPRARRRDALDHRPGPRRGDPRLEAGGTARSCSRRRRASAASSGASTAPS